MACRGDGPDRDGVAEIKFTLDMDVLKPLIREVAVELLERLRAEGPALDGPLAYSEEEAARLLDLQPHVLRDERRRGRIRASTIVGRRVRYTRDDLVRYLMERRSDGAGESGR